MTTERRAYRAFQRAKATESRNHEATQRAFAKWLRLYLRSLVKP